MKKIICLLTIFLFLEHLSMAQPATVLNISDTRSATTTPTTYCNNLMANFKMGSVMGLPSISNFYGVIGLRAWSDNSGGPAHELAFSNDNNIFIRSGYDSGWGPWGELIVADNINGDISVNSNQQIGYSLYDRFTNSGIIQPHYGFQWIYDPWSTGGNSFWLSSYGGIKLFTGGAPRFAITGTGDIGIGTTSPQSKLAVNGTITATEVKVTQTGWPDFVFDSAYRLEPLSSVEKYIQKNNHLPDIPSAKEIEGNGLDLGSMVKKQMQKIEELMLYQINANKRINELEDRDEKLRKEITVLKEEIAKLKNK
jgi:hypothetical protein